MWLRNKNLFTILFGMLVLCSQHCIAKNIDQELFDAAIARVNSKKKIADNAQNEIMQSLDIALSIYPNDYDALRYRARLKIRMQEFASAKEDYDRLLAGINSEAAKCRIIADREYNYGRYQEAMEPIEQALKIHPDMAEYLMMAGLTNLRLENPNLALDYFNRVVELTPQHKQRMFYASIGF